MAGSFVALDLLLSLIVVAVSVLLWVGGVAVVLGEGCVDSSYDLRQPRFELEFFRFELDLELPPPFLAVALEGPFPAAPAPWFLRGVPGLELLLLDWDLFRGLGRLLERPRDWLLPRRLGLLGVELLVLSVLDLLLAFRGDFGAALRPRPF